MVVVVRLPPSMAVRVIVAVPFCPGVSVSCLPSTEAFTTASLLDVAENCSSPPLMAVKALAKLICAASPCSNSDTSPSVLLGVGAVCETTL